MKNTVFKTIQIVLVAILAVILCAAIYISARKAMAKDPLPTIFGYAEATVTSGSMEDTISVGDMVVIKAQDDYSVGDIVCYKDYSRMDSSATPTCVTHRIVDITEDGYITRGDANNSNDPYPILKENIVGTVVSIIPGVGAVTTFFHSTSGIIIIVLILILIIVLPILIRKMWEYSDEEEKEEERKRIRARHSKSMNRLYIWIIAGISVLFVSTAGFTVASYVESKTTTDSARAAGLKITMSDLTSSSLTVDCNKESDDDRSASTSFTVTGTPEVSCTETIIIDVVLPEKVTMSLEKNSSALTPSISGNTYTYTIGNIAAGTSIDETYTLIFTGSKEIRDDVNNLPISIKCESVQID